MDGARRRKIAEEPEATGLETRVQTFEEWTQLDFAKQVEEEVRNDGVILVCRKACFQRVLLLKSDAGSSLRKTRFETRPSPRHHAGTVLEYRDAARFVTLQERQHEAPVAFAQDENAFGPGQFVNECEACPLQQVAVDGALERFVNLRQASETVRHTVRRTKGKAAA